MPVKVWIGGEGACEIGDRDIGGSRVGAIEALVQRIATNGWVLVGATKWQRIRKFKVSAAIGRDNHADIHNIAGLVNEAYENACEVVAFCRDVDTEAARAAAIAEGVRQAQSIFPLVEIIGEAAIPTLEGWILALRGVRGTEGWSRERANKALVDAGIELKSAESYVEVVEAADLATVPTDCGGLVRWMERATDVFRRLMPDQGRV